MIFNPWGEINNLKNLIDTNDKISVYGVFSNKRPLTQYEIKLNIQKNDDTISLMTNVDEKTGFRNLYIKITKDKGIIENISIQLYDFYQFCIFIIFNSVNTIIHGFN